ncbi:MAG: hypothetical protein EAY69_11885 [Cytophagales bacterium]|nr:MAG: hypothetical protein EAY69_11885 [Cytophagales bacterium]
MLSAHKNTNTSVGNFVIYRIMDASGNWLKYGKADADRKMANGDNLRAHTSARLASKKYPKSTFHIVKTLFNVTTEYAKSIEKRMVETARKYGQTLPLNRER